MSLNGGFKAPKNDFLQPVDNRIYNPAETFNQDHQNKLYKANTELLAEIEKTQQMRQAERSRRTIDKMQDMAQQVEEISPSGVKRQIVSQAGSSPQRVMDQNQVESMEQSTGKAANPFIDDQQEMDGQVQMQPRNMFSVKFGGSATQNTMDDMASQDPNPYVNYHVDPSQQDPNCRRELPENPNYAAPGGLYTMGAGSQQEIQGQVARPETGTFSEGGPREDQVQFLPQ